MAGQLPGRRDRPPKLLDAEALWDYALKLLSGRALSLSEARLRLSRKAQNTGDVDAVLAKLREYGYLNDAVFAQYFAAMRKENQGLGRNRVVRELRQRRVSSTVAEKAVAAAFEGSDEIGMIEQFLAKKFRNVDLREYLREKKQLAAAFRRLQYAGFSTSNSIRVLRRYADSADELEES